MESNRDEALRCLHISQKHRAAGNLPSARKFVQKSLALFSTPEATKLLESIDSEAPSSSSSAGSSSSASTATDPTSFTSATETHPSASGAKHRHAPSAAESTSQSTSAKKKREYTAENLAVVKRVRTCKVTEYYEILEVKKDCEEAEVKKAYRKVSCGVIRRYDIRSTLMQRIVGASTPSGQEWCSRCRRSLQEYVLPFEKIPILTLFQWFPRRSRSFLVCTWSCIVPGCLMNISETDPQKRAIYDRSGDDPESRFGGMSSSGPSSGFQTSPFGGATFEGELSPEDLFNMFFGGGAAFSTGPGNLPRKVYEPSTYSNSHL